MDYGMYTSEGNVAVAGIVYYAQEHNLSWKTVYQNLVDLAKFDADKYGEALDTTVRECVYNAIGAYERDENFYV
jgi:predicted homoserine dehydrogenase-like protein